MKYFIIRCNNANTIKQGACYYHNLRFSSLRFTFEGKKLLNLEKKYKKNLAILEEITESFLESYFSKFYPKIKLEVKQNFLDFKIFICHKEWLGGDDDIMNKFFKFELKKTLIIKVRRILKDKIKKFKYKLEQIKLQKILRLKLYKKLKQEKQYKDFLQEKALLILKEKK
ncbi:hypothetical protein MKD52_02075 [Helicobacter sp. CaF467b]|uniref:hypothetical protein n=1 Tax=Helicobacter sp. CaF467b TaxID=2919923 RepID=UPI001F5712B7|nr:hypothetical protein [Helicobacter sp. CaF467b]MCI2235623.1 hypothetical protein [Helicobacter sp. CaF467b]